VSKGLNLKAWWRASSEDERRRHLIECNLDPNLASKPLTELTAAQRGIVSSKYHDKHEDDE
jgi:hypothetical protein